MGPTLQYSARDYLERKLRLSKPPANHVPRKRIPDRMGMYFIGVIQLPHSLVQRLKQCVKVRDGLLLRNMREFVSDNLKLSLDRLLKEIRLASEPTRYLATGSNNRTPAFRDPMLASFAWGSQNA